MSKAATCGDYGGQKRGGEPCGREAGWGTDHLGEGRCKDHGDEAAEKAEAIKKAFLAEYAEGTKGIARAAQAAGTSHVTVWRWRREDPEFDRAVDELQEHLDPMRTALVEETLLTRLVTGKANSSEYFFWLVNRSGGRWRNTQHVELGGKVEGGVLLVPVQPATEEWAEAARAQQAQLGTAGAGDSAA